MVDVGGAGGSGGDFMQRPPFVSRQECFFKVQITWGSLDFPASGDENNKFGRMF